MIYKIIESNHETEAVGLSQSVAGLSLENPDMAVISATLEKNINTAVFKGEAVGKMICGDEGDVVDLMVRLLLIDANLLHKVMEVLVTTNEGAKVLKELKM